MLVLPCRAKLLLSPKELHQAFLTCEQNQLQNCTQIISISLEIDRVDPLVVLHKFAKPDQLNFYFENKNKGEAIAAIDAVAKLELEGKERFSNAQRFINSCLASIIPVGTIDRPFAGPHFFCSFSFFDENAQADYPFSAGTVFLPRWQVACKGDRCVLVANLVIKPGENLQIILQDFWNKLQKISLAKNSASTNTIYQQEFSKQDVAATDNFKRAVISCLESIRNNRLSKIVLAHALDVSSGVPFNLFESLKNLRRLHPNCYVFSTSSGKGQNFIGASPERLMSIHNQELMTDAMAGSAPRGKTSAEDTELGNLLLSSEKERHEHQVVTDFITQHLYQLGIKPTLLSPRLRQLSNIQHLWTPIHAKVPANVHPLEIVAELHPTPAVAGVARDIAMKDIRRYESFERGLYAAPLGWVDYQGNSEFIVGIRSALIDGSSARLYAGAGIVGGSDPDKELAEIQLKLQALLKALV